MCSVWCIIIIVIVWLCVVFFGFMVLISIGFLIVMCCFVMSVVYIVIVVMMVICCIGSVSGFVRLSVRGVNGRNSVVGRSVRGVSVIVVIGMMIGDEIGVIVMMIECG